MLMVLFADFGVYKTNLISTIVDIELAPEIQFSL